MNNAWSQRGLGRTAAGTMIGILATTFGGQSSAAPAPFGGEVRVRQHGEPSTTGSFVSVFSGRYSIIDNSLIEEIAEAYERFAEVQKPLDPEFARLLSANLWDLYAR